jgi:hypothetical protein
MHDRDDLTGSCVPFARRWDVVDEIDLVRLVADHTATERLCACLEDCADRLPERPAPEEIDALCEGLQSRVLDHVEREDQLLAAMFERDMPDPLCHSLIAHIHARHVACTVQAQDLISALKAGSAGQRTVCAEALGYMLRCFFDGCRAAMAFEELTILALADTRLTPGARALLADRLASA